MVTDDHIIFQQRAAVTANCNRTKITAVITQDIPADGWATTIDTNPPSPEFGHVLL